MKVSRKIKDLPDNFLVGDIPIVIKRLEKLLKENNQSLWTNLQVRIIADYSSARILKKSCELWGLRESTREESLKIQEERLKRKKEIEKEKQRDLQTINRLRKKTQSMKKDCRL